MTKGELSQLHYLNREIEQDKRRLQELEAAATSISAKITGLPHVVGIANKPALAAEIGDARNIIAAKLQQVLAQYNRLNRYISTVGDSQMRQILTLRYVSGLSWQQLAFSMGESDESLLRKKHDRFLKVSEISEPPVLQ